VKAIPFNAKTEGVSNISLGHEHTVILAEKKRELFACG